MIYTGTDDVRAARELGGRIKKEVNKRYRLLEIELDGIFKCMLLLKKKKYAAMKLEPAPGSGPDSTQMVEVMEQKGLDIVRRDWSLISKDVGNVVLSKILSGRPKEEVVMEIHEHLRQVKEQVGLIFLCLTSPPLPLSLTFSMLFLGLLPRHHLISFSPSPPSHPLSLNRSSQDRHPWASLSSQSSSQRNPRTTLMQRDSHTFQWPSGARQLAREMEWHQERLSHTSSASPRHRSTLRLLAPVTQMPLQLPLLLLLLRASRLRSERTIRRS